MWSELSQPGLKLWLAVEVINGQVQKEGQISKVEPGVEIRFFPFDIVIASDGSSFFILMTLPGDQTAVCGK